MSKRKHDEITEVAGSVLPLRTPGAADHETAYAAPSPPPLPLDVWELVLYCLPYEDVRRCADVNRFFRYEAVPLVKHLTVFEAKELCVPPPPNVFRGVTSLKILSLTRSDPNSNNNGIILCRETAERLVPFLSRFPNLKQSLACGEDSMKYVAHKCVTEGYMDIMRNLLLATCSAYRSGALSQEVQICISDLKSIRTQEDISENEDGSGCQLCREVCMSMPFKDAYSCRHSIAFGNFFRTQDCLSHRERTAIIVNREGGRHFLQHSAFQTLLQMKITFRHFVLREDMGLPPPSKDETKKIGVIDLGAGFVEDVEHLRDEFGFDPKLVDKNMMLRNLGFFQGLEDPCISRLTFDRLVALGLPIDVSDCHLVQNER